MKRIILIVEGHGEVVAAPLLARRVLEELYGIYDWTFETQRRNDIAHLRARGWESFKRYLAAAFNESAPILWMLDCDDGCALELVRELHQESQAVSIRQPLAFCLWVREYETMFFFDPENVGRKLGVEHLNIPNPPESRRSAKEFLGEQMPYDKAYSPRLEQPAITAIIDLHKVQEGYRSFKHFEKALLWLIQQDSAGLYPLQG